MALIDKVKKTQDKIDSRIKGVGHGKYGRILRMARKPDTDEYVKVLQITALGAALIGGTGFVIYIFFSQIGPWLWTTLQAL